jgi:hypothetical protein
LGQALVDQLFLVSCFSQKITCNGAFLRAVAEAIWSVFFLHYGLQNPAFSLCLFDIQRHLLLQPAFYCDKVSDFVSVCALLIAVYFVPINGKHVSS